MNQVLEFVRGGGVMMYPLLASSVLLVALIIERFVSLRRLSGDGDDLMELVRKSAPEYGQAESQCKTRGGALGRVFSRGLRNSHRSADAIEMAMEQEAANELPQIDANLPIIKTIINIAPLLGLLGTIAGMITSFRAASQTGLSNPTQVLGGISEALISTATGITVAVVGFIFYNYFANQGKKIVEDIEYYGAELVNLLTDRVS
jgi:biopolymer transport protein ExbB